MYSIIDIVPFKPGHVNLLDFSDSDAAWLPNPREQLQRQANGNGYTILIDGRVSGIAGAMKLWDGLAEGWFVPARSIRSKPVALMKMSKRWIAYTMQSLQLRRFQCHVKTSDKRAIRFAESLGFVREATLLNYGHDGSSYDLMAIVR